jgi:hypothetical protein
MDSAKGHYKAHYSVPSFTHHAREFKQYIYIYVYIKIKSYKSFTVLIYVLPQPSIKSTFVHVSLKKVE